jgi:hypothetical protein
MARQAVERLLVILRAGVGPGRNCAFAEAEPVVRHDEQRVAILLRAETVARRAGAERVVEREQARLDLLDREAGHGTGELGREQRALAAVRVLGNGDPLRQLERRLETLGESIG